jgi:hypothetical protein
MGSLKTIRSTNIASAEALSYFAAAISASTAAGKAPGNGTLATA